MTRLLIHCFLLAFSLFFLGLVACHKDKATIINGTIIDAKTSLPIEGVEIIYGLYAGNEQHGTYSIKSDISGKVSLTLAHDESFSGFQILKTEYVPKFQLGATYTKGVENDVVIIMHPRDAILRLVYLNTTGEEKPIYTQAQSHTFSEEYGVLPYIITQPFPYICQPNSRDTLDYHFTSDEPISLFWGFNYFEKASQAPFQDFLNLNRGDTATYIISI